jgi:hypothetical protein
MSDSRLEKLNQWLILIANVGVLAGVFLLAVEIRQNQAIMERDQEIRILEAAHLDVARFTEWRGKLIADRSAAGLYLDKLSGKELDEVDEFRFSLLCNDLLWAAALMHERSIELDRHIYEQATITWMQEQLQMPAMQGCWDSFRGIYTLWGYDDFVRAVEAEAE